MDVDSLGSVGSMASYIDKQLFGAQVVSKTLDYMNSGGSSGNGGMAQTYEFSKDVLGGYMAQKGLFADTEI